MTDQTRFRSALCISLFLHFMLLQTHWAGTPGKPGKGERLSQAISSSAPLFSDVATIAIESVTETAGRKGGDDIRQKERSAYLEAVSDAIHARRFIAAEPGRSLIGLAWFSFTIMPDGHFHNLALLDSSGNPALDMAAETALRSASGVVKRPASLGREEIILEMAVKYQYDW